MNTADNSPQNKKTAAIVTLLAIAVIAAVLSSLPAVQNKAKSFFVKDNRIVLAKLSAFYGVDQHNYLILKIKDAYGIHVEIFQDIPESGQQIFKQKFEMLHDSDAYITLDKNTTNFALSDANKDGQLDIIAPSVDRNGNLRLNTFRYNNSLNIFEPMSENTAN